MTRYVKVPEPVKAVNPSNKRPIVVVDAVGNPLRDDDPWTLERFLWQLVLNKEQFCKGTAAARKQKEIGDAIEGAKPGDVIELADSHWRELKSVIEGDGMVYPSNIASQLLVFADAILDATEKPPKEALAS